MTRRTARHAGIAALALTAGLTLTACSDDPEETGASPSAGESAMETTEAAPEESESPSDDATSEATPDDTASAEPSPDDGAGAMDPTSAGLAAIATAEAEAGGTAYSVDRDDVRDVWEVDVAVDGGSVEIAVDASGSEVERTENDDLDAEDRTALDAATVGLSEAIQRVVGESGGTLDDADLDVDDGAARWNVTVLDAENREQDYLVDTASGEVTRDTDD